MKIQKRSLCIATSLTVLVGGLLTLSTTTNAHHVIGYTCENQCIVVVHPITKRPNIVDCCGGGVTTKVIEHDRFWAMRGIKDDPSTKEQN